jgi:hypothetical protein
MLTGVFRRLSRSSGANSPPWIRFSLAHIRGERESKFLQNDAFGNHYAPGRFGDLR